MRFDDGIAVYLNGQEIMRSQLEPGANFDELSNATTGDADETAYRVVLVDPDALVDGTNVIAAEVHQCDATSSDVVFDLALDGLRG